MGCGVSAYREGGADLHGVTALFRQIALPWALCAAVFVVANYSMTFPRSPQGISSIWLTNGLPLAALLRSPRRQWPWLIAAAMIGNAAALVYRLDTSALVTAYRACGNAAQYTLCAYVLRRRLGDHIDIAEPAHLIWIGMAGALTTCFKLAWLIIGYGVIEPATVFHAPDVVAWLFNNSLGLFVLLFPILAITSGSEFAARKIDAVGGFFLLILGGTLFLVFGPFSFPGVYMIIPPLMLLAWRHGLRGAGIGALLTIIMAAGLSQLGSGGIAGKLVTAGYSPIMRGAYLELFFSVAILSSIPLAVARTRQQRMDMALEGALLASQQRAAQLAESEAAALDARERLRTIIETSTDIICTLDREGRFVEISENCEALWGWPRASLLGKFSIDFMHPDQRAAARRNFGLRTQGSTPPAPRYNYVRPDGTLVPMFWSATWIEKDQVCHCVGRDMTQHDALQAQANIAQRMEAIGQLTGGVAHDFNNLLTVVIGSSATLADELSEPRHRRLAELVLRAARQGGELTRQLLAFARRQALAPQAFDINRLLDDNAALIRRTLGADLDFSIRQTGGLRPVYADPNQTEAAILTLCINARDAMPDGGKLVVETKNAQLSQDFVRDHPEAESGDYIAIRVRDTGTGMTPDIVTRIFEPFFTTKEAGKGTGLGLSMVYGFVKQSGGYIDVESEPGRGTTFTLYLPVTDAAAELTDPFVEGEGAIEGGSENVLIVEDDDLVREHARGVFEGLGYQVTVASTGAEALSILEAHDDIDLLFTDVVMPGGMNGRQLAETATARWPWLRVLYTSGHARDALSQDGRLVDGVTLLPKPYSKRELSEKARKVLDEVI